MGGARAPAGREGRRRAVIALGVVVAGGLGAALRYIVDGLVQERWEDAFPAGTFAVNLSGAFALGVVTGFVVGHPPISPAVAAVAGTGFVGAYTTFSTWMYESLRLLREGGPRYAALNLLGSTAAGLLLASLGLWIGGRL